MKQDWTSDEVIEHFTLQPAEKQFLGSNDPHNQLGKALLLKFFQYNGRFPENQGELLTAMIDYIAQQLDLPAEAIHDYDWQGRRQRAHRQMIREWLGFRPASERDQADLHTWIQGEVRTAR